MSAHVLEPGRIVGGRYTIRRVVSHGQASSLYEAITAPSREIFLEVFAPDTASTPNVAARLEQVGAQVNALPSSLVLPIVEASIDRETGCPFVASEASVTPSLAELVKLCPLANEELVAFVARLCAALDAAHARGLVHAALEPAKVFVGPAPRCDVRLAGLGTGFLRGHLCDPIWSAPEAYAPTPHSDVYSTALLTVFATCGELPADPASVVNAVARNSMSVGVRQSAFDSRIAGPLARALAPSPTDRQNSAGDLARAIGEAMGSKLTLSSAWRVAPPASEGLVPPEPIPQPVFAPPPPPAAQSLDALTTPVGLPAPAPHVSQPAPAMPLLGSRAKLLLAAAASLVGVAIVAIVITSKLSDPPKRVAAAPSSPIASAPVNAPAPAPVPVPSPTQVATATPPPIVPDEPANPSPTPPAKAPPANPSEATLVVECTPECASITVDGNAVESTSSLKPGAHVVVVKRGLHGPQTKYVKLGAGKTTTISFIWWKTPPGPPKPPGAKKPCGKFLQRCD